MSLFPLSKSIDIDKKIINLLPIKDQISFSMVNKNTQKIFNEQHFENKCRELHKENKEFIENEKLDETFSKELIDLVGPTKKANNAVQLCKKLIEYRARLTILTVLKKGPYELVTQYLIKWNVHQKAVASVGFLRN